MTGNVLIDFVVWTFSSWMSFFKATLLIAMISPTIRYEHKR